MYQTKIISTLFLLLILTIHNVNAWPISKNTPGHRSLTTSVYDILVRESALIGNAQIFLAGMEKANIRMDIDKFTNPYGLGQGNHFGVLKKPLAPEALDALAEQWRTEHGSTSLDTLAERARFLLCTLGEYHTLIENAHDKLLIAVDAFLHGDSLLAIKKLGQALHSIQDFAARGYYGSIHNPIIHPLAGKSFFIIAPYPAWLNMYDVEGVQVRDTFYTSEPDAWGRVLGYKKSEPTGTSFIPWENMTKADYNAMNSFSHIRRYTMDLSNNGLIPMLVKIAGTSIRNLRDTSRQTALLLPSRTGYSMRYTWGVAFSRAVMEEFFALVKSKSALQSAPGLVTTREYLRVHYYPEPIFAAANFSLSIFDILYQEYFPFNPIAAYNNQWYTEHNSVYTNVLDFKIPLLQFIYKY